MSKLRRFQDYAVLILCAVTFAFTYALFIYPNQFAPSGLPGIATIIEHLTGIKTGYLIFAFNVPLVIITYRIVDRTYVVRSTFFTVVFSVMLVVFSEIDLSRIAYHTQNGTSTILAPVAAGVVCGFSYSIVMKRNSSTGGTDLIAAWVHHYHPEINLLWIIFSINALVAVASYFVYDFQIEPVILCLFYSYISSKVGDGMLKGFKEAVKFEIVTDTPEELSQALMSALNHGVTELSAMGGFTHNDKKLLICIVNKREIVQVQKIIQQFPTSFAYLTSVKETMGNFRR